MTKINRLRSFVNLVPRHALLTMYKTNILPVFGYGSIIYDSYVQPKWLTESKIMSIP